MIENKDFILYAIFLFLSYFFINFDMIAFYIIFNLPIVVKYIIVIVYSLVFFQFIKFIHNNNN